MNAEEIAELIQHVPCSFSFSATVAKKTKSSLETIIAKLLKEDQTCIYDTEEEAIRDYNFLSYLFWCTGNVINAFQFNQKALERNDKNITAVVNKIWFYLELPNPFEANTALEHFQNLKQDKNFESICLIGEAEIAYAYTRLGFRHYERAVDEFQKVLMKADKLQGVDKNSIYLWKAGLGLMMRRLSHVGNVRNQTEMQKTKERLREAIEIFVELVESDWDSERNKAFSYVQLAQAAESVEWEKLPLNEYFPTKYMGWDIETFYHMAERHYKGDTYTLERYGKFLRQKYKLDEAEEKLRASISIMPTSTAHHYLALVLKAKLNNDLKKSQRNRPFGTSSTRPRTTEYQRYGTQDYRPRRFDFAATQDTRSGRRFQDQQMERKGQNQRYTRSQPPYTSSGSMEREANTSAIRSKVKCPTTMLPYPKGDDRVSEILYHLDQAIMLGENRAATYDKGLILRATGDFDGAIETFKSLIKEETSLMYLANAYEQFALCLQTKLEDVSNDLETRQRLSHDRKSYLMKSVAVSTNMVSRIPNVTQIWHAGISLKNILNGEGKSKETLNELALLNERLNDYKDAVACYNELLSLDESEQENPEILMKIIKNQMANGNFVEAVSVFDLIMMMPSGTHYIDDKLYCSALIEAGFKQVREKDESNTASGYLKTVLNHSSGLLDTEGDSEAENGNDEAQIYQTPEPDADTFDVFILCSENDDNTLVNAKQMADFLRTSCNVTATLNREDVIPGRLELSTMLNFISQSRNVVVCLGESISLDGIIGKGLEHAARKKLNIVVVLMSANAKIPNCLLGFPSIIHETRDEVPTEMEWMKSLFYKLAGC